LESTAVNVDGKKAITSGMAAGSDGSARLSREDIDFNDPADANARL
jgi:hypothetical protein